MPADDAGPWVSGAFDTLAGVCVRVCVLSVVCYVLCVFVCVDALAGVCAIASGRRLDAPVLCVRVMTS